MSLLSMCQAALEQLDSVEVPASIVGNSNQTAKQMLRLANVEGDRLRRRGAWPVLRSEHTFTTVSGTAAYDLPSDWAAFINGTWWDRANYWPIFGPATPQQWQQLQSGYLGTVGLRRWFTIKGSSLYLYPTPSTTGDTIAFEYRSANWCQSSGGTGQTEWSADTDTGVLSETIMQQGLVWRFLRTKGLPYEEEMADYEALVIQALGEADPAPKLYLDGPEPDVMNWNVNVPEMGFGA